MTTYDSRPQRETPQHFVYVDGPSIDGALGDLLERRPTSFDRPDWRRLEMWVRQELGAGRSELNFATYAPGAPSFINFLESAGFNPLLAERMSDETCADVIADSIKQITVEGRAWQSWGVVVVTQQAHLMNRLTELKSWLPSSCR